MTVPGGAGTMVRISATNSPRVRQPNDKPLSANSRRSSSRSDRECDHLTGRVRRTDRRSLNAAKIVTKDAVAERYQLLDVHPDDKWCEGHGTDKIAEKSTPGEGSGLAASTPLVRRRRPARCLAAGMSFFTATMTVRNQSRRGGADARIPPAEA